MLSDVDIVKILGKKFFIYPFNAKNLKGASINLTASNMAWSMTTKKSIVGDGKIIIPAHDTALIMTVEILHLSPGIGGTIHSKLTDICRGLGHDASTLNPGWFGRLVIPIHNYTPNALSIDVGNTFITMLLDALPTKTSKRQDENATNRTDLLYGFELTQQEHDTLYNHEIQTIDSLKKKVKLERTYDMIKNSEKRALDISIIVQIGLIGCLFLISLMLTRLSGVVNEDTPKIVKNLVGMSVEIKNLATIIITALVTNIFATNSKRK